MGDRVAVGARLVLESYNLSDENPAHAPSDAYAIGQLREAFALLGYNDAPAASDGARSE